MQLTNRTVLVTGASRGIGRAFVDALLARGVRRVYAAARNPDAIAAISHEAVVPLALDVTRQADVDAAAARADDIDVLINNAGSLKSYSVLEASRAELEADLAVNFYGALAVTRAFAPILEQRRGAVVNVLTLVSLASMAGIGGYSASKAAAWSMTQSLRVELGRRGVQVFGVYPGAVDTDMIRSFDMPKTPPAEVAANALAALEAGELDCFPDPMSKQAGETWKKDPRALERMFAEM